MLEKDIVMDSIEAYKSVRKKKWKICKKPAKEYARNRYHSSDKKENKNSLGKKLRKKQVYPRNCFRYLSEDETERKEKYGRGLYISCIKEWIFIHCKKQICHIRKC